MRSHRHRRSKIRALLIVLGSAWFGYAGAAAASGVDGAAPAGPARVNALLRDHRALAAWLAGRSSDMAASQARIAQARADVGTSGLIPNPVLDASINDIVLGPTNPRGLSFNDYAQYTVGLSQTIEIGKRGPRMEAARLRLESARRSSFGTLQDKISDARVALAKLVYMRARQAVLEETYESASQGADLEKVRFEHGDISGRDYSRLVLELLSLQADLTRARAETQAATAACRATLYAPCDLEGATIGDVDAAAPIPTAIAARAALARRPDLQAMQLEANASREDAVAARRKAIPDPTLRVGYTRDQLTVAGDQANTLSVGVTIPLPLFDHGQHDAAKAEARATELDATGRATLTAAEGELDGLLSRRASLEKTITTMQQEALPKSAEVLTITEKAFRQGQVSLTDLLLARRTHVGLLLNVIDLSYDFFSVRNDLRKVLGLDVAAVAGAKEGT